MKALERNGYRKEGVFQKSILKNGKIWDEHRFAKIKQISNKDILSTDHSMLNFT
jgi:RimJ/RimL family protein N-acetyltransferase